MVPRLLRLHPLTYRRLIRLSKEAAQEGAYRVAKRRIRPVNPSSAIEVPA